MISIRCIVWSIVLALTMNGIAYSDPLTRQDFYSSTPPGSLGVIVGATTEREARKKESEIRVLTGRDVFSSTGVFWLLFNHARDRVSEPTFLTVLVFNYYESEQLGTTNLQVYRNENWHRTGINYARVWAQNRLREANSEQYYTELCPVLLESYKTPSYNVIDKLLQRDPSKVVLLDGMPSGTSQSSFSASEFLFENGLEEWRRCQRELKLCTCKLYHLRFEPRDNADELTDKPMDFSSTSWEIWKKVIYLYSPNNPGMRKRYVIEVQGP
jgi:hypothetical protein